MPVTNADPGVAAGEPGTGSDPTADKPTRLAPAADLDEAAGRQTVIETPLASAEPEAPPVHQAEDPSMTVTQSEMEKQMLQAAQSADEAMVPTDLVRVIPPPRPEPKPEPPAAKFLIRLLLPDGDRRSVPVADQSVIVGSGLDEVGLTGDPKIGPSEGRVFCEDGDLFLEPADGACGIFRRIVAEEDLALGDVVLIGDIAARFVPVDPGPAVDGSRQVLGGGANTACGRLTFLRRDGSDGPIHDLPAGKTIVGRTDGHLNFPQDSRLSRRHARFFASDQVVTIEDLDSRNGTYLRVRKRTRLRVGDALRVGSAGIQIRAPA